MLVKTGKACFNYSGFTILSPLVSTSSCGLPRYKTKLAPLAFTSRACDTLTLALLATETINFAREKEYGETILGRRRYLRDINSRNITTRGFAERNAINAPIQGSATDIIKIAMIQIHKWLEREKLKTKMIMQVHDELVFDLHHEEQKIVKLKVIELMRSAVILDVPMEVEVGIVKNWLEAH